jgi:addiction module HigA family antidote
VEHTDRLPNIHPGEVLREEFLGPLGISQCRLVAKLICVPEARISAICQGKRAITADTVLRLVRVFGTNPGFWLGLQDDYDVEEVSHKAAAELARIELFKGPQPLPTR